MDYFIFGEFMSCFIDFIDINLLEKYTLTNLVSKGDSQKIRTRTRFPKHPIFRGRWLLRCQLQQTRLEAND